VRYSVRQIYPSSETLCCKGFSGKVWILTRSLKAMSNAFTQIRKQVPGIWLKLEQSR